MQRSVDHHRHVRGAFAWRSGVVFVVVGLFTHLMVQDVLRNHFRDTLDFHAEFVVRTIVEPLLPPSGELDPAPAALAEQIRLDEQVLSVKVVDDDGAILFADGTGPVGPRTQSTAAVPEAATHITRVALPADSRASHVDVVQDQAPTLAAAADLTQRLDLLLLAGLVTMWGMLLPLAARLGSRLQARTAELETQHTKLQRLLDREHQTVTRLEEVNRLKDDFLTTVSHELRTPLTIVTGTVLTLQEHGHRLAAPRQADLLDRAVRSAHKLEDLLSGLLDLSRPAERPTSAALERVDLKALVTETTAHLPPVPLTVDLEVGQVRGDRLQLERVMANLVGNAIRHAPGGAPVTVRSQRLDGAVEITVSDRGPGVPDDLKQAVFEPFRQGELQDAHAPGTGIGLALVARFVGAHGGCTWVSDRPGGGSTFHVRLPTDLGGGDATAQVTTPGQGNARPGPPAPGGDGDPADLTTASEGVAQTA